MVEAIAGRDYRGLVSSVDQTEPPRPGLPPGPVDTPPPAPAIRASLHVLAGLPLSITGWTMVVGVPVAVWYWPVWRLMYGHVGYGPLSDWPITPVLLVLAAGLTLLVLPARIRAATRWQRLRFRYLLAVELPPPPPTRAGRPIDRLVREWTAPGTWRQFLYHAVAPLPAAMAAVAVPVCWLLAPPFAPRAAGALADADAARAGALLGPSLAEEMARQLAELAHSRAEVIAATDAERRRIERDLHDGAQQRLVSLAMKLGLARTTLTDIPEPARRTLDEAHDELKAALAELRGFVRGLHPPILDDRGLDAALSAVTANCPVPVRLRVRVADRCAPAVEAVAYFVVCEALTNVAKHARASRAEVDVERTGDRLRIVVSDDGCGGARLDGHVRLDGDARHDIGDRLDGAGPVGAAGTGLRGLARRASAVDGTLSIVSPTSGPTRITVELPCGW
ncbi:histidine kinase [Actinoplanes sp. NBRC 103695]|nr:histidine kinase [Actinoplanes sp. NBRC 103695]